MFGAQALAMSAMVTLLLTSMSQLEASEAGAKSRPQEGASPSTVTFEGRVVCLDSRSEESSNPALCDQVGGGGQFALRTVEGALVSLLPDDPQAAMMIDPRVRARTLQLTGWPTDEGALELLHVHEVRRAQGKTDQLYDLDYRCDTCNITATAPGPCWCCQKPFELRESPVRRDPAPPGS